MMNQEQVHFIIFTSSVIRSERNGSGCAIYGSRELFIDDMGIRGHGTVCLFPEILSIFCVFCVRISQ